MLNEIWRLSSESDCEKTLIWNSDLKTETVYLWVFVAAISYRALFTKILCVDHRLSVYLLKEQHILLNKKTEVNMSDSTMIRPQ